MNIVIDFSLTNSPEKVHETEEDFAATETVSSSLNRSEDNVQYVTSSQDSAATMKTQLLAPSSNKNAKRETGSLGTWIFDKKRKKKIYTTLLGAHMEGHEAINAARRDKQILKQPFLSSRLELESLTNKSAATTRLLSRATHPSFTHQSHKTRKQQQIIPSVVEAMTSGLSSLGDWGIPEPVLSRYRQQNVHCLFPWQVECLSIDDGSVFLYGTNLIYSAPTSGGKTLVAEILMLRRLALIGSSNTGLFSPSVAHPLVSVKLDHECISQLSPNTKKMKAERGGSTGGGGAREGCTNHFSSPSLRTKSTTTTSLSTT